MLHYSMLLPQRTHVSVHTERCTEWDAFLCHALPSKVTRIIICRMMNKLKLGASCSMLLDAVQRLIILLQDPSTPNSKLAAWAFGIFEQAGTPSDHDRLGKSTWRHLSHAPSLHPCKPVNKIWLKLSVAVWSLFCTHRLLSVSTVSMPVHHCIVLLNIRIYKQYVGCNYCHYFLVIPPLVLYLTWFPSVFSLGKSLLVRKILRRLTYCIVTHCHIQSNLLTQISYDWWQDYPGAPHRLDINSRCLNSSNSNHANTCWQSVAIKHIHWDCSWWKAWKRKASMYYLKGDILTFVVLTIVV